MARKLRLEFPGAIYHVISRGNYRKFVFDTDGARRALERCLFAACERYHWSLHAYTIMGNHFHLAVETPQGNLSTGMHWLLSAFSTRFNRYRREHGHVFQGRFKALLVEEGSALGLLCDYIHLNPARAGMVAMDRLPLYLFGSYWHLWNPAARPPFLRVDTALLETGGLPDNPTGWRSYHDHLAWQLAEGPAGSSKAYVSLSKGWLLGSQEFKEALIADHQLATTMRAWESSSAREVREVAWSRALAELKAGVPKVDLVDFRKSAPWKVRLAVALRCTTDVSNGWLATRLAMGSAAYVSKHVSLALKSSAKR